MQIHRKAVRPAAPDGAELRCRFSRCPAGLSGRWKRYAVPGALYRSSLHAEENPVVAAVVEYVQKHYDEELSLKILAQKYKVNAAYLGQLFKHETGELFSAYLCRIRIENAKVLLRETSMKANEISERTGFTNTNYFSNTFKKMTGIYPSEYRTMSQISE